MAQQVPSADVAELGDARIVRRPERCAALVHAFRNRRAAVLRERGGVENAIADFLARPAALNDAIGNLLGG